MKFSNNLYNYYFLSIINLILWVEIAKKIQKLSILKILGQNTLLILGIHYYILFFLRISYKVLKINEKLEKIVGIFFLEAILIILISYILITIKNKYTLKKFKKLSVIKEV